MRKLSLFTLTAVAALAAVSPSVISQAKECNADSSLKNENCIVVGKIVNGSCNLEEVLAQLEAEFSKNIWSSCFSNITFPDCSVSGNHAIIPDCNASGNDMIIPDTNVVVDENITPDCNVSGNDTINSDCNVSGNDTINLDCNTSGNEMITQDCNTPVDNIITPDTNVPENDLAAPDADKPGSDNNIPGNDIIVPDTDAPENDIILPDTNASEETSFAQQILTLVNKERAKAGLKEVILDENLEKAAAVRAREIERTFSHTRPDGSSFSTVLKDMGVTYKGAGENIAWGQKSPQEVMEGWMNSPGHRANILNPQFTKLGVGHYQNSRGTNYWVQLFIY